MAPLPSMLNLPNALSVIRIVLVPLLVVVMLTPPRSWDWTGVHSDFLGALIFGLASLTDLLDGWLARRRRQITTVGEWLDPLADKLLVLGALISLVQLERAPAWMVTIIVGRELAVTGLRSVATVARRGDAGLRPGQAEDGRAGDGHPRSAARAKRAVPAQLGRDRSPCG